MQLSLSSLGLLKKAGPSSIFRVKLDSDIIEVISEADRIEGDLLMVCGDRLEALRLVAEHSESIGWFFCLDPVDLTVEVIAKPKEDVDGLFERILSNSDFEKRDDQLKIARIVFDSLKESKNAIIEAPTGVGKSLAYLVGCVVFCKEYKERVVISTNTINLQRQLIEKDIPFLQGFIDFKATLALGRSNYLCKRKAIEAINRGSPILFEGDVYKSIGEFLSTTKTGLKSEFFSVYEGVSEDVWRSIESSTLSCAHSKCPYYKNSCFFYRARSELEKADVIVANHHLVLSDSVLENARILPDAYAVVFDEAHNIERNATNYYTVSVSSDDVLRSIDMLYTKRRGDAYGFLAAIDGYKGLKELIVNLRSELADAFDELIGVMDSDELRIDSDNIDRVFKPLNRVLEVLSTVLDNLKGFLKENKDDELVDVKGVVLLLSNYLDNLGDFLNLKEGFVCWMKRFRKTIHLNMTPLDVRDALRGYLYKRLSSVVFVSATLSVGGSLDFFKNSVGVDGAVEFIAEGNFDYERLSRLFVVEDVKEPMQDGFDGDVADVVVAIGEALKGSNKGVLVLFTSYAMLNGVYDRVHDRLKGYGFRVYRQGELDNFELLNRFKKGNGFLFATGSFWEGIDVRGEGLSVLVMVRLPFEVPTTPIEKARYDLLKREGHNAFFEYALPKAVIRFRQGLGRLIRKSDDHGVMVVLDSRILSKSYGDVFLRSIPHITVKRVKKDEVKDRIVDFFVAFDRGVYNL